MSNKVSYSISPVDFTQVQVRDQFWLPRLETNRQMTIPYNFTRCEDTGRIDNFAKAGGLMEGDHEGIFYNDSDVFKVVEGAAYSLSTHPDPELEKYLDDLIAKMAASQEEDGYLYTARTIAERNGTAGQLDPEGEGRTRWSHLRLNHELYNVGHMYEAGVAYFQATGKRSLLDVSLRNADLIDQVFGPDGLRDVPGHQEIEIGLVKLFHITGDERYLQLSKFFVDERGQANGRELYIAFDNVGYMQDHMPMVEQSEAVGHAVRAGYIYSGVADVASLTGKADYVAAIDRIWADVVSKKLYITGGIGARHKGEAFGNAYELPNDTAYAETCAAIANALWNQRMFFLHGHAKYIDIVERVIYNGFLSGVSFSGDRFFYVNPLSFDGESNFNRDNTRSRQPWFGTSCCPTNVVRFLPSLPGYTYARQDDRLYINLFIAGDATISIADQSVAVTQETLYPWDGHIKMTIKPEKPADFTVCIRIPGWASNQPVPSDLYRYIEDKDEAFTLLVNGEAATYKLRDGFAHLRRRWEAEDTIELTLPMPVRQVVSHEAVKDNVGRVALERGPLVYCVEGADNGGNIDHIQITDETKFSVEHQPDLLNGVTTITGHNGSSFTAIPYYAWAHRELQAMTIWIPKK
ncbi:MAG: glycoside hydrolase family 127 protein [Chloroflexota bacterium]